MVQNILDKINKDLRVMGTKVKGTKQPSSLSCQSETVGSAEVNTPCRLTPGLMAGVINMALFFMAEDSFHFNKYILLERNGIHPSRKGRRIFASRLIGFVRCALSMEPKATALNVLTSMFFTHKYYFILQHFFPHTGFKAT